MQNSHDNNQPARVEFNHTIVSVSDKNKSAAFYADVLGLPEASSYGPFRVLNLANGVSLDFADELDPIVPRHYAFLANEAAFDAILGRIKERGLTYWSDPFRRRPGEINHNDGGSGVYWEDPDGHMLEIVTVPYGGKPR